MKVKISHLYIHVSNTATSFKFYKDLLQFLEFTVMFEDVNYLGLTNNSMSIWLESTPDNYKGVKYHRKQTGVNHFALYVPTKEDVDEFYNQFLKKNQIETLYDSPKSFPE